MCFIICKYCREFCLRSESKIVWLFVHVSLFVLLSIYTKFLGKYYEFSPPEKITLEFSPPNNYPQNIYLPKILPPSFFAKIFETNYFCASSPKKKIFYHFFFNLISFFPFFWYKMSGEFTNNTLYVHRISVYTVF